MCEGQDKGVGRERQGCGKGKTRVWVGQDKGVGMARQGCGKG